MDQKKLKIALVAILVLFVVAAVLSEAVTLEDDSGWDRGDRGSVIISEIMASNRTYPAPDGRYLDFVEVRNLSPKSVDISGYMICDDLNSIGYTFPDRTVLPGGGYMVVWCDKEGDPRQYATFGISRQGGESIYLYNGSNVIVDEKELPFMEANVTLVRVSELEWQVSHVVTPGYENSEAGYEGWLRANGGEKVDVHITEIVTDNTCVAVGEGQAADYVELTNFGSEAVQLQAYLSNDPEEPLKWQIPAVTIGAGERIVIPCSSDGDGVTCAPFGLRRGGCTVVLTSNMGNVLSRIDCPALDSDCAYAMDGEGAWSMTELVTPGFENTREGHVQWMESKGPQPLGLVITEVMTANRSTLLSKAGALCDWVEITNTGSESVSLAGMFLSDDPGERGKWAIPEMTLQPGQRKVFRCVGEAAAADEAPFGLSRSGSTVLLSGSFGNVISSVEVPRVEADRSWAMQADGTYAASAQPSPGYENTEKGYLDYRATQNTLGKLAISEVMPANDQFMIQSDGNYYDWVELVNVSSETLDLSAFCLSNDAQQPDLFRLPAKKLAPGGRVVIICSANDRLAGSYIQAPFTLSSEECWVYVSDGNGRILDLMCVRDVPAQGSAGRAEGSGGTWYFQQATPGNPNGAGVALISKAPVFSTPGGVFEGVKEVKVELSGAGALHYTLDGSLPTTEDPLYTAPFTVNATTVVRAACFEDGKLPSKVTTAGFIVNEGHSLPVVSLSAEPGALFGDGIYDAGTFDSEQLCNLQFFETDGSFTVDCGVELAGSMAKTPQKRSLKVNFRGRYGAGVLGYSLFGSEGPQVFDALTLSAGSDDRQTMFRDELFGKLGEGFDNALVRRSRFCVLYINGQYWGVYSLKEALGELYYAQHTNAGTEQVEEVREPALWDSDLRKLALYCEENDMSLPENYEKLREAVDEANLIDWLILQGYSSNSGVGEGQRYYRANSGGKWQIVLTDMDKAFYYRDGFSKVLTDQIPWCYGKLTMALMKTESFRTAFLQRLTQMRTTALSDQTVLAAIDDYEKLLQPEMQREMQRWGGQVETWQADVQRLREFITRYDHWEMLEQSLRTTIALTDEEAKQVFGT